MNDDDRLHDYLAQRAETITLPPLDPSRIVERATRRRHRRRTMSAGVAALAAVGATVAFVDVGGTAKQDIQTLGNSGASIVESPYDWTLVERPDGLAWSSSSATMDDGSIYSLSSAPGPVPRDGHQDPRSSLYRSDDGLGWSEVALPSDVFASSLAADGGRLYAAGTAPAASGGRDIVVAASDDGGDNWSDAVLDSGLSELDARYPRQISLDPPSVATSGDTVVVAAVVRSMPDVHGLLLARGVEADSWGFATDGVDVYAPFDHCAAESANQVDGERVVEPCEERVGVRHEPEVIAHYTWDELGLDPVLRDLVNGRVHVFRSTDGSTFEPVALDPAITVLVNGGSAQVLGSSDGIRLFLSAGGPDQAAVRVLHSADGTSWTADAIDNTPGWLMAAGLLAGRPAVAVQSNRGSATIHLADDAGGWSTVDLGPTFGLDVDSGQGVGVQSVAFGPLGMALIVGTYAMEPSESGDGGDPGDTFLMHSSNGSTFGRLDLTESIADDYWPAGVTVTADAVTVRLAHSDGDVDTVDPQRLLVGTPTS